MTTYHLVSLDRKAYSDSIAALGNDKSVGFARLARSWWDRHFSWKAQGCIALADEKGTHLSYIFYKIDRYREYLTIHNLFTPFRYRRKGHAQALLSRIFARAGKAHVRRFRLASVPQSLPFYSSQGFVYWGVNTEGDFYCDLPLPEEGLEGVPGMVKRCNDAELAGERIEQIIGRVGSNETDLTEIQHERFEAGCDFLGENYRHDALMQLENDRLP